MSDIIYYNKVGQYRIGDHVLIHERVGENDTMRTYVDDEHPTLELMRVQSHQNGDLEAGSGEIILRSWDGRETGRSGWAIQPLEGGIGCYKCKSTCKSDEVCPFFQELNK